MNYKKLNIVIVSTLALCFTSLVLILLYLSSVTANSFEKINELKQQRKNISYVLSGCYELEAAGRGYSITGMSRVLDSYEETKKNVVHRLIEYKDYLSDKEQKLNESIENLANLRIKLLDKQLVERKNDAFDYRETFQEVIQNDVILDSLRKLINVEQDFLDEEVLKAEKKLKAFQNNTILVVVILTTVGFFIILMVFFILRRKNKENEVLAEDLKMQKKLLNKAEDITKSGSWLWNLQTQEIQATEGFYKRYMIAFDETITVDLLESYYDPEYKDEIKKTISNAVQTKSPLNFDLPIILRNGKRRILNVQGYYFNLDGEDYYIGANWNVTKQRIQEEQLS